MIPFNRFASTITLALTLSVGAQAQSTNLEKDVESYFQQALNTQLTTEVADRNAFTNATYNKASRTRIFLTIKRWFGRLGKQLIGH